MSEIITDRVPAPRALHRKVQTYTAKEVAKFLRRRWAWVYDECEKGEAGEFPGAYRDAGSRDWRVPHEDVVAYQDRCRLSMRAAG